MEMNLQLKQQNSAADGSRERPFQAGVNNAGIRKNGVLLATFTDSDGEQYYLPKAWDSSEVLSVRVLDIPQGLFHNLEMQAAIQAIHHSMGDRDDTDIEIPDIAPGNPTQIRFRFYIRFRQLIEPAAEGEPAGSREVVRAHVQTYWFDKNGTPPQPTEPETKIAKAKSLTQQLVEVLGA